MQEDKDILKVEEDILSGLDRIDTLIDEYKELCNKINGTLNLKNWRIKKFLKKDIIIVFCDYSNNIWLLSHIQLEQMLKLTENELSDSNNNLEVIAEKLTKIAPKYSILRKILGINCKTRLYNKIRVCWELIPYLLWDQHLLTEQYKKGITSNNINFQVKSILTEIIKKCELAGANYDMFLTRISLYEKYTRGTYDVG